MKGAHAQVGRESRRLHENPTRPRDWCLPSDSAVINLHTLTHPRGSRQTHNQGRGDVDCG